MALLAVAAGGIALRIAGCGGKRVSLLTLAHPQKPSVEIALANRTLCATGFPIRFCEHQTASVRGTAPYVVALTNGASKAAAIKAVRDCGARVIGPLPPNALLVETSVFALGKLSQDALFAAASEWLPEDKLDARLKPFLDSNATTLDVTLIALAPADVARLADFAVGKGGERLQGCLNGKSSVTLKLPRSIVAELAKRGDVRWMEPFKRPELLNDAAVGPTTMNVRTVWDAHGLTGAGQLVTTSDSGIDTGNLETMHADLKNRVIGLGVIDGCYDYDANGHGTHTAGSIVGDGTCSDGQIRGTAYGAKLWAWFCGGQDGYIYLPDDCGELFRPSGAANACIHSASWGSDDAGAYDSQCHDMDEYVWEHPEFLPVIANGNSGSSAQTVGSPATAKNVLSVGATQNARSGGSGGWGNGDPTRIAPFSSRGPCADGRIKPDVCAPGVGVASTRAYGCSYSYGVLANANYAYNCGTSMATPLTAGAAALVRQWLIERRGFTNAVPTAALVKAVLTGGGKGVATPNHSFGWGRVDLGETLYPSNRSVRLVDRVPFFDGTDRVTCEVVLTNAAPFDVQLVWIDHPATAGASKTLVNDLDLIVSNKTTGAVWYGNGTSSGDHVNNVESVRISPAEAGDYAVIVRGTDISYDSAYGGAAAVYVRGSFEDEKPAPTLEIVSAEPAAASLSMSVGETNVFSVTVKASTGVSPTYAWTVDDVVGAGATTNRFAYGTGWADHGRHCIRVDVSAAGSLSVTRAWTVTVRGEVRVDAASGDDATATGALERPYATISAALARAVEGDVLRVGPGAYAGVLAVPTDTVRIESTSGPESTVIDGGGTNRCFDASECPTTVLAGFTLTNGWVDASSRSDYGAGALYGVLTNCVICGCLTEGAGGYGGGAAGAELVDCVIENCCGDYAGGGLYGCTASFCLVRGNGTYFSNSYGGGASASVLTHCTVYGNVSGETAGGGDCNCVCTNSIVWDNVLFNGETSNWESIDYQGTTYRTEFAFSCTTPTGYLDGGGNTNETPRWVNAGEGDFQLVVKSPCLGTANDGLNMGAWQGEAVPGYVITATANGPGEVFPAEVFVVEGEDAEFTATMHHPFFGWTTNGVAAADAVTNVFVWTDVHADGVIAAAFGTTNFFVDATTGNDASNGWSWAEAKRTIQAAVDAARDGETVSVAPGVYTGEVDATAARIDIVAEAGPETTVIAGDGTNRCYAGNYNAATTLRGFTLDGGVSAENYGGGVFYGTLSNCVIRNCRAGEGGGGAYNAVLTDCIIAGCAADYGGGACGCTLTRCVIANCTAEAPGGGAYGSYLEYCTVRGNRAMTYYRDYRASTAGGGVDYQCDGLNTILWDNIGPDGLPDDFESIRIYNWRYGWSIYEPMLDWCCAPSASAYGSNCLTNDPRFASVEAVDPRLYEISPCLGAGFGGVNIGAYRGTGEVKALPTIDVRTATGEEVSNAVASVGYVDPAVAKGIGTNGATYAAFQTWSTNGLKSTAVVFSTRAYDSFLVREIVSAPTLLGEGNETTVALSALEPASDGTCSTTLRLLDGENEIPLCSVKAAFAKHTQVGDDVSALAPADAANVEATSVDEGRAVKLTLTPPSSTLRYFMRFSIR